MQTGIAASNALLFCELGIAALLLLVAVSWAGPKISARRAYRAKDKYVAELRRK
jgi:hypothetical protein